jgi:hypothetical protein
MAVTPETPHVAAFSSLMDSGIFQTRSLSALTFSANEPYSLVSPPCTNPATRSPVFQAPVASLPIEDTTPAKSQPSELLAGASKSINLTSIGLRDTVWTLMRRSLGAGVGTGTSWVEGMEPVDLFRSMLGIRERRVRLEIRAFMMPKSWLEMVLWIDAMVRDILSLMSMLFTNYSEG